VSAEKPGEWPLTHDEIEEWCRAQTWHFAKTMADNPHYYVLKRETDPIMFQRVVLCIREFGYQYRWGRGSTPSIGPTRTTCGPWETRSKRLSS
jgi:hypothetical protein